MQRSGACARRETPGQTAALNQARPVRIRVSSRLDCQSAGCTGNPADIHQPGTYAGGTTPRTDGCHRYECFAFPMQPALPGAMEMSRLRRPSLALMLAVPALAAFAVYVPTLPGGFLSDDYSQLHMFYGADAHEIAARVGKTFVSGVGPPSNQYRPLTMASFAANMLSSGADPAAVASDQCPAPCGQLGAGRAAGMATRRNGRALPALRGGDAAGIAFAWFPPSAEAVAWISARFDGMALFWMLVAACAFMASREWRDRYGLASLAAAVLAFMSKESAAIGPALIVALAWVKRPEEEGLLRGGARALAAALPWLAIAAAYFAYRAWMFGDPFRFYPGTSPGLSLLSGKWLAALPASGDWWPLALPEAGPRRAFAFAGLLLGIAAVSAGLRDRARGARARRPSCWRFSRRSRCCSRTGAGR